jgi:hypothetical protein
MKIICFGFILFLLGICGVSAQELPYIDVSVAANEAEGNDITLRTYFKLVPAINWQGRQWVIRNQDLHRIGYATWDELQKRYIIFNLRDEYRGFIQATIGQNLSNDIWKDKPPHYYTQYLWYWSDNRYIRFVATSLGGRPPVMNLPQGELGGDFRQYTQGNIPGNIPLRHGKPFGAIEPLKGPMGIDISVIYRLPTIISR